LISNNVNLIRDCFFWEYQIATHRFTFCLSLKKKLISTISLRLTPHQTSLLFMKLYVSKASQNKERIVLIMMRLSSK